MKYKELVKKASISQTLLECKQEMEKLATVQKYMNYGLSFDTASALVKSSATITGDVAKGAVEGAKEAVSSGAHKVGKITEDTLNAIKEHTGTIKDIADNVMGTASAVGGAVGKKDKKFTAGHMLGVGAGAAGLAGLAGLSVGMNHSRDKKRMPDYGQE